MNCHCSEVVSRLALQSVDGGFGSRLGQVFLFFAFFFPFSASLFTLYSLRAIFAEADLEAVECKERPKKGRKKQKIKRLCRIPDSNPGPLAYKDGALDNSATWTCILILGLN